MKRFKLFTAAVVIGVFMLPGTVLPCTTFVLDNGTTMVVGRNYDWTEASYLLMVNKRGVSKTAMPSDGFDTPNDELLAWTSKYGSVTFNGFCRELPGGGINEAGLVIEPMLLSKTEYPEQDARFDLNSFQWVQYQLDTAGTVDEVIESDKVVRIREPREWYVPRHFLVADSMGKRAVVEFLDGKMICYAGGDMPVAVLANSTYDTSLAVLGLFQGFGGFLPVPRSDVWMNFPRTNSLSRFVRAAEMARKFDPQMSGPVLDYAFDMLAEVAQPEKVPYPTLWSAVYDMSNRTVYFRTIQNSRIRYYDLSSFDFSCVAPIKVLDIFEDISGDVSSAFIDYTEQINRDLLKPNEADLPDDLLDYLATYPEKYTSCTTDTDNTTEARMQ